MRPKKPTPKYGRILLKLSGEALGAGGLGIDPRVLDRTALEIGQLVGIGVEVGMVIIAPVATLTCLMSLITIFTIMFVSNVIAVVVVVVDVVTVAVVIVVAVAVLAI